MVDFRAQLMDEVVQQREALVGLVDIRNVKFFSKYEPSRKDPAETIRVDWVEWTKVGEQYEAVTRFPVKRLMPLPGKSPGAIEWSVIGPMYESWIAGREHPIDGTPLEAWNGLDVEEVAYLHRALKIETLEQFVNLTDSQMARCAIHAPRERIKRAKTFLDAQKDSRAVQAGFAERDETIRMQQSMLESQSGALDEMRKRLELLEGGEENGEPPRRRGRPRKVDTEYVGDA